jgi:large subunit ribosomal protein L1
MTTVQGKRYREATAAFDHAEEHTPAEAIGLVKSLPAAKFDETVEASFRVGIDTRKQDQTLRGTVTLPNGSGRTVRVAVFAQGDKAQEALRAGADEVGGEDLVKKIEAGWLEFDVALATPDSMGMVGKLGKILGRRGLMPNPKAGTITFDLDRAVREVKGGRVEFKVDKAGIIHTAFGRASFEADALVANLAALIDAINRARPTGAKGQYLKGLTIATTMGPGIRVDLPAVLAAANAA